MTQITFDTTLIDSAETDLFTEEEDSTRVVDDVFINTDNDAGVTNGFHTVNSSGDTLTLRFYRKDQAGNYKQVDSSTVDQGQSNKFIELLERSINHSDFKVTAQLSTNRGDVRITGDIVVDESIENLNDFDSTADAVQILDTGGSAGKNAEEIVDDIMDEDIVANHNTDDTLGKLIEVLAAKIEDRSNNANLADLLGVADSSGSNLEGNIRGADDDSLKDISDEILNLQESVVLRDHKTAQAGSSSDITLDSNASSTNDFYRFTIIVLVSGTGAGQKRIIDSYDGGTKVATVARDWLVNPDSSTVFSIISMGQEDVNTVSSTSDVNVTEITGSSTAASDLQSNIGNLDAQVSTLDGVEARVQLDDPDVDQEHFQVIRGSDRDILVRMEEDDGSPLDLQLGTGADPNEVKAIFPTKSDVSGDLEITETGGGITIRSVERGELTITLTDDNTSDLKTGHIDVDIEVEDSNSIFTRARLVGAIEVLSENL